jgi:hypothetical protein
MKPLHELLKDGDPLAHEPGLVDPDIRVMRSTVVSAVDAPSMAAPPWRHAALVTAMAMLMLVAIATVARREPAPVAADASPTEMQFSTPGGTRVIWVFQGQR